MSTISQATALREERNKLLQNQRAILDRAEAAQRLLTNDEARSFDNGIHRIDDLTRRIGELEGQAPVRPNPEIRSEASSQTWTQSGAVGGGSWLASTLNGESRSLLTTNGGGYIVPPEHSTQVWDRLAAASVGLASGFTILNTERDELHIPRLTADASASWTTEGSAITATDPTLSEVIATPRKLAALVAVSNETVTDSNPGVLSVVETNLIRSLALKLDSGFFEGSGTAPEIRGLKNVAGIGTVSMGTNGATPTNLDPVADAIGTLAQTNATATAIVMHPRTWQTLSKLKEQATGNNKPLLQDSAGSGTAGITRAVYGVPVYLTSQVSITDTVGTSTDCSAIYVYQADQVVAVRRSDVTVEVDRSRLFNQDMSEVRAVSRWDLVVPNTGAIVRIGGVRP